MLLQESSQCPLCVVNAGFHGAELCSGDAGDFFEREIFEEVQQQDGALRERQLVQKVHELGLLLTAEKQIARVVVKLDRCFDEFLARCCLAISTPPELNALLMG